MVPLFLIVKRLDWANSYQGLIVPFLVDGFSGLFLAVIAFMAVMSALYSIRYMDHYPDYGLGGYYLCYPLFVLGMAALVTVDDLALGFTVAWQVMTVASFFLVTFEDEQEHVRHAGWIYLVATHTGTLLLFAAFALLAKVQGHSAFAALPAGLPAPVERFYRTLYGDRIPVITSAVITSPCFIS